jgi:hypothetical protein
MNFWQRTAPAAPVEQPRSLGEEYRAWQRSKAGGNGASGSAIYAEPAAPAARRELYVDRQYGGLQSYAGEQADPLDRRPGESVEAWRRRVTAVARALPDEEVATRLAAIDQADDAPQNHDELRAQMERRVSGTGVGILHTMSASDRAAALNGRGNVSSAEHLGAANSGPARPASMADVLAAMHARELAQRGQQPQRQEIPAGSSATGWMTR